MNQTPLTADPAHLKLHPLLHELPGAPESYKTGPGFDALCDHLLATGAPITPIPVVGHQVVTPDAARMMFAARQCGLTSLPTYEVPPDEAALVISEMCHRLHYTKGQQAYLLWPLVKQMIAENRIRRAKNVKTKGFSPIVHSVNNREITVEDFAHGLGMSRTNFYQARDVYALFAKHPDYKAVMEPKLLGHAEDTVGLGAIIAGFDGFKKTGSTRPEVNQLELFSGFTTKLFKYVPPGKNLNHTIDTEFARASEEKAEYLHALGLALVEGYKTAKKRQLA